jgi:hypothetical protein
MRKILMYCFFVQIRFISVFIKVQKMREEEKDSEKLFYVRLMPVIWLFYASWLYMRKLVCHIFGFNFYCFLKLYLFL